MVSPAALPNLPALTADQAENWIAAALAEVKALRQHDAQLYPTADDAGAMDTARQIHAAWRGWADAAEALYDRIAPLLQSHHHLPGVHDLNYAIGRTRAMLQHSPESMLARHQQIARGQVLSPEEARRELRLANRR